MVMKMSVNEAPLALCLCVRPPDVVIYGMWCIFPTYYRTPTYYSFVHRYVPNIAALSLSTFSAAFFLQ